MGAIIRNSLLDASRGYGIMGAWQHLKQSPIKALNSGATPSLGGCRIETISDLTPAMSGLGLDTCIKKSGRTPTGQFQPGTKYTTRTATRSITIYPTWSVSRWQSTGASKRSYGAARSATGNALTWTVCVLLRVIGIGQMRGANGILNTARQLGRTGNRSRIPVLSAAMRLSLSLKAIVTVSSFALTCAAKERDRHRDGGSKRSNVQYAVNPSWGKPDSRTVRASAARAQDGIDRKRAHNTLPLATYPDCISWG